MSRPWMPLYVADYLVDTAHLDAAESGAYLHLIMSYWVNGSLPHEDQKLARIARMTAKQWNKSKATIKLFFDSEWRHDRIDRELAEVVKISNKRKAAAEQMHANREAKAHADAPTLHTSHSTVSKKDTEAIASGADAPRDVRAELFGRGLQTLARLTGKGPDACRSFVGKCLKAASDDAVTVLGLIEDAERNQVVDPSAWISARLKPSENGHGKPRNGIIQAADDLRRKLAGFDGPAGGDNELRSGPGGAPPRLLSHG